MLLELGLNTLVVDGQGFRFARLRQIAAERTGRVGAIWFARDVSGLEIQIEYALSFCSTLLFSDPPPKTAGQPRHSLCKIGVHEFVYLLTDDADVIKKAKKYFCEVVCFPSTL